MQLVFFPKPDCGAVIALKHKPRRRVKPFCYRSHAQGKFRVFKKKGNERQTQAGFITLGEGGNQVRRLFVQGLILALSAQDKVDIQCTQSVCELITCDCNCLAHNQIISHMSLSLTGAKKGSSLDSTARYTKLSQADLRNTVDVLWGSNIKK